MNDKLSISHEEDTDYTDEQGGGEAPLTEQEFMEALDKAVKALVVSSGDSAVLSLINSSNKE